MKSKYTFNEIEEFLDKCNAPGIKILNGTSKQFLKADGSLDTKEYLSTAGGTVGIDDLQGLIVNRTNGCNSAIAFKGYKSTSDSTNSILGYLGFSGLSNPCYFGADGTGHTLLHSGNVGEYALKIDGSNAMTAGLNMGENAVIWSRGGKNQQIIPFPDDDSDKLAYYNGSSWKTIAFTYSDITGYAAGLKHSNGTAGAILNSSGNVTIGSEDKAGTGAKLYVDNTAGDNSLGLHVVGITSTSQAIGSRTGWTACIGRTTYGLLIGSKTDNGASLLQVGDIDGTRALNMSLNPFGGKVLIGTANDNGSGAKLQVAGTSTFGGQSTFNAGITIPSGQSITFVDANGNNHVVSWDDTAGGLKIDDKIITVN